MDSYNLIIKIALESNSYNCFKVYFKTKDNKDYSEDNVFNVYYYDEDNFEHYLLLPNGAVLDDLKIVPGHPSNDENDYLIINSFEIKGIDN